MEKYLEEYDNYRSTIVYYFTYGSGGIGDMLKYFMYLLAFCIKNKIQLKYFLNDYPISKFIKLKHEKMYEKSNSGDFVEITHINQLSKLRTNVKYLVQPFILYKINDISKYISFSISNVFYFSKDITNMYNVIEPYNSIHLRLGDKFIETESQYKACPDDIRDYDEERLVKYIRENSEKRILFFCDNKSYKRRIKNKFPSIRIIDHDIGHTSYINITDKQMRNTIVDFYLICKSDIIVAASKSGFSEIASYFYKSPFLRI